MKDRLKKTGAWLFALFLVFMMTELPCEAAGNEQRYSYYYDEYQHAMPAPDPYRVSFQIDMAELGGGQLRTAGGMYVQGDRLYLCDTGNDRILELRLEAAGGALVREIGEAFSLSGPKDVFVGKDGSMYIADTGNNRILCLDEDGKLIRSIEKPETETYDASVEFRPEKLVVTWGNRLYVQAAGVNKGLLVFDENGVFEGYMGASSVRFDFSDYIWKRISTRAQRAQMESFVPTEYNNVALDAEGFVYVTTSVFSEKDLVSGDAEPIRRLNLKGDNILIENGSEPVVGDLNWDKSGPSRFVDVTVLDSDIYVAADITRNRLFAYDKQGNLLFVFGGYGTRQGYFQTIKALEHWGEKLLVLDETTGLVTVLEPTEYGGHILHAIAHYDKGLYEEAFADWEEALRCNGTYRLAYDGMGKIFLREGNYKKALDYLEYAGDAYYYSKAFSFYRKDWMERNLIYFVAAVLLLFGVLTVGKIIRREKGALKEYEREKQLWNR